MLKPKGLGQDTVIGSSCGGALASPIMPPGVLIFIFLSSGMEGCGRFKTGTA